MRTWVAMGGCRGGNFVRDDSLPAYFAILQRYKRNTAIIRRAGQGTPDRQIAEEFHLSVRTIRRVLDPLRARDK